MKYGIETDFYVGQLIQLKEYPDVQGTVTAITQHQWRDAAGDLLITYQVGYRWFTSEELIAIEVGI